MSKNGLTTFLLLHTRGRGVFQVSRCMNYQFTSSGYKLSQRPRNEKTSNGYYTNDLGVINIHRLDENMSRGLFFRNDA